MKRLDIKRIRNENKLTQVKLAHITGYPQGFISQLENGNQPTPKKFISKIAEKFHIDAIDEYIFDDEVEDTSSSFNNMSYGRNANWQNGTSDLTVQKLLGMIEKKEERIDEKDAKIAFLEKRMHELEAEIWNLKNK
jgi:transcriptional regulator with XRE-family HTH domain